MSNVITAAPDETTLVVRRTYRAPRERVFSAWLDPDVLSKFIAPDTCSAGPISVDARVGGTYFITMNAPDGEMVARGEYLEISRPERIVFTWKWDEDDPTEEHDTQVTLEFADRGEQTELTLTHERLRSVESRDNHTSGWSSIADNLERVL